jgi:Ca2+:H+ antiporter
VVINSHLRYICSRIFYHNPPGEGKTMNNHPMTPAQLKKVEEELQRKKPEVNQWVCIVFLLFNIAIMAVTSEWVSAVK